MNGRINKKITPIALIIILGFAVYGNSLKGKFILDDEYLIRDNACIKTWSCLPEVFTKHIGAGPAIGHFLYRPLQMITYMVDYSLWMLDPRGYHLTNILLHVLVTLAIYWLINILYDDRLLSLLTSILFIVHPIHVEAVTYISGRADSLALLFMILSFIFYVKHLNAEKPAFYLLALLSYISALLSRENSLILPVLLLLYHYTFKKKLKLKYFLPISSIAFIYILLRLTVLKSLLPHLSSSTTLFQRMPGFFVAITDYIKLILFPLNLHMEYGNKLFNFINPKAMLGILALLWLLTYALRRRSSDRLLFFSIYWFFIALLPQSNLYPIPMAYMAEHWLYVPSIGFFLLVANGLSRLYRNKTFKILAIVFITSIVAFYSSLTVRYNKYWKEPIIFYERTLRYVPDSIRALGSLANRYRDIGKNEEAIALYKKLIKIDPNSAKAYNNLGIVYSIQGEYQKAVASFQKAIKIDPYYAMAYNNLGNAYSGLGKYNEAITSFQKAIEINPSYAKAYNNLGNVCRDLGKHEEAMLLFKIAIEINPDFVKAYYNLGLAYYDLGKKEEAISLFKKAIEIDPNCAEAHNSLAVAYYLEEQYQLAIEHCDMAVKLGYKVYPEFLKLIEECKRQGKTSLK